MSARDILIGYSKDVEVSEFDFNVAGFFATLFKQGVIGVILSYWFYLRGLRNVNSANFWYTLVIVALSFFTAHTHGTFYMLFFVCFQMYGYATEGNKTLALTSDKILKEVERKNLYDALEIGAIWLEKKLSYYKV